MSIMDPTPWISDNVERKLSEKLERFRRGGTVTRYHTHNLLKPPNDAEHQYNVAVIADQIYRAAYGRVPHVELFTSALYHDQAEYETGDIPGWVKRRRPKLKAVLKEVEAEVERNLDISVPNGELGVLIKVADDLEHVWTCLDEYSRGNQRVSNMFPAGAVCVQKAALDAKDYPWSPIVLDLIDDMVECYIGYGGKM